MKLSDKTGVQHIVKSLASLGLKEVVICPGSRNAPFTISFNRHPAFNCSSVRDERSAAFFALGKAIELKQPVAVVCTSGSAALNFAPAISEAYYQRIPLIVITADRPKEWIGQGDGQTINQSDIYRNYIRKSYDLNGDAVSNSDLWLVRRSLSEGFNIATVSDKGPVHYNVSLNEPLYVTSEVDETSPRIFKEVISELYLSNGAIANLSEQFYSCRKVMVLVGQHHADQFLQDRLEAVSHFKNLVVLTESTANVHHSNFIENIDQCITHLNTAETEDLAPELLITVGDAIVSKRIKKLLRDHPPKYHWNVHPFDAMMDTYQSLTCAIKMEPVSFFNQIESYLPGIISDYRDKWLQLKEDKRTKHNEFCANCGYSDLKALYKVFEAIPQDISVHVSNSSPIRYAQLFDNSHIAETWCNRGTSGIDGCTATVVGAAAAAPKKKFLLITGDMAFYYDINGLWNDLDVQNLKIIIINNGGGGIFRILEGSDRIDEREKFIESAMNSTAEQMAAHHGWEYLAVKDEPELDATLKTFFSNQTKRTILEIFTDAEKNPEVLKQYWNYLKEK